MISINKYLENSRSCLRLFVGIFASTLASCDSNGLYNEQHVLRQGDTMVIAYTKDWAYQGSLPVGDTIKRDESFDGWDRIRSQDPACWDFGAISWIAKSSANPRCGGYEFEVVHEVSKSRFWADVWLESQDRTEVPFGRISVEEGLLSCYRYYLKDGTYFEFKDMGKNSKCDW